MFKNFWTLSLKNDLGSASIIGFAIFFVILGTISMIFMNTNESVELARLQAQTDNATVAGHVPSSSSNDAEDFLV